MTGRMSHPTFGHQPPRGRHLHAVPDPVRRSHNMNTERRGVRDGAEREQLTEVGCLPGLGTGLVLLALVLAPWAVLAVSLWAVLR